MSDQPKPTGEWTLVPCALHFNIMCGDTTIYEGVTSEKQGKHLADAHNAALDEAVDAAEQEILLLRQQLAAEREKKERK